MRRRVRLTLVVLPGGHGPGLRGLFRGRLQHRRVRGSERSRAVLRRTLQGRLWRAVRGWLLGARPGGRRSGDHGPALLGW